MLYDLPMRIIGNKLEIDQEEQAQLIKAQDRAIELVRTHLAELLEKIESLDYSRLDLAFAYLLLAYHALRYGKSKTQANRSFRVLAHLARERMEHHFEERRCKLN